MPAIVAKVRADWKVYFIKNSLRSKARVMASKLLLLIWSTLHVLSIAKLFVSNFFFLFSWEFEHVPKKKSRLLIESTVFLHGNAFLKLLFKFWFCWKWRVLFWKYSNLDLNLFYLRPHQVLWHWVGRPDAHWYGQRAVHCEWFARWDEATRNTWWLYQEVRSMSSMCQSGDQINC